jgi:hypothetical protein
MNLISNDELVRTIFDAVTKVEGATSLEKLKAVIRAGKIAEAYQCGGTAFNVAEETLAGADHLVMEASPMSTNT